jgi:hypothetical protein
MKRFIAAAFAAGAMGCSMHNFGSGIDKGASQQVIASERQALESQTLSSLAAIERSLNDFVQRHRRIPKNLDELVPEFLAEIPTVSLGIKGYKSSNIVKYYPPSVIVDGRINGAALEDSGGWGYAHNDRQVIVFVDCTRKRMNGSLWFRARGVY